MWTRGLSTISSWVRYVVLVALDVLRVSVEDTNAPLFSVWGAAALPYLVRFLMKRRDRRASGRPSQSPRVAKPPVTIPLWATIPDDGHVDNSRDERMERETTEGYRQAS